MSTIAESVGLGLFSSVNGINNTHPVKVSDVLITNINSPISQTSAPIIPSANVASENYNQTFYYTEPQLNTSLETHAVEGPWRHFK